jgi:predicted Zn-ribbon and HTH transcriptional regulator
MLPVVERAAAQKRRCELGDIFRNYGEPYRHNHSLPLSHLRVMRAVERCRTAALGGHLQQCDACGFEHPAYNSCRNRHCPKCQSLAKARWLEKQKLELLPVGYFHLVFTLPHELNRLILVNKKPLINILFKAVSETQPSWIIFISTVWSAQEPCLAINTVGSPPAKTFSSLSKP